MDSKADPVGDVLQTIAHCPIALELVRTRAADHPCSIVVHAQRNAGIDPFHLPEPWNGDIVRAPILFISTNPSVSEAETYPTAHSDTWPDDRVCDFFTHRFGGGEEQWSFEGRRALQADGSFAPRDGDYWSQVQGKARDILGREPIRGKDWALTEVVHCKSVGGRGVDEALAFCTQRYLDRVITVSGARLVVCFGSRQVVPLIRKHWDLPGDDPLVGPVLVAGRMCYVALLKHPQNGSKHLSTLVSEERLSELRAFLASAGDTQAP